MRGSVREVHKKGKRKEGVRESGRKKWERET